MARYEDGGSSESQAKTWYYEAHNAMGQPKSGTIEADSEAEAAEAIREQGLYARELDDKPLEKMKYESPVIGAVKSPVDEAPDEGHPNPVQPEPDPDPMALEMSEKKSKKSSNIVLKNNLESVSEVLRLMHQWSEAYQKCATMNKKLPEEVPKIGGKTWEIYRNNSEEFQKELMKQALLNSAKLT